MTINRAFVEWALTAADDTRMVVLESGALASVAEVFGRLFGHDWPAAVVADPTTWAVAGQRVDAALRSAGLPVREPIVLAEPLHAEYERALEVQDALEETDQTVAVAVGSGTVNDLVKLASRRLSRRYMVVATAASMDGYAAFGASITHDGFKQTMPCPAPAGIVADLDILAAAPTPLTAAGYGDLLGKITAGADWMVADALEIEEIDDRAWSLVQEPLAEALGSPERLRDHDADMTEQFFLGLVTSGLAMQATQSSRPASGAEHLLSHLWEMTGLAEGPNPPSHGTKVGIGTVLVSMLYDQIMQHDLTQIDVDARVAAQPSKDEVERAVRAALPAGEVADRAVAASLEKLPIAPQLWRQLDLARRSWPDLRKRLQQQLLPPAELQRRLRTLGAAALPSEIGVTATRLRNDLLAARYIRSRYTVLDLAAEAGLLERCVDGVIAALSQDERAGVTGSEPPR